MSVTSACEIEKFAYGDTGFSASALPITHAKTRLRTALFSKSILYALKSRLPKSGCSGAPVGPRTDERGVERWRDEQDGRLSVVDAVLDEYVIPDLDEVLLERHVRPVGERSVDGIDCGERELAL